MTTNDDDPHASGDGVSVDSAATMGGIQHDTW